MKKKALIIVDHGSTVKEANDLLVSICDRTKELNSKGSSEFEIVKECHMELAEPTIKEAFDECVSEGASDIVVHPYFLAPGRHSTRDIPRMVEEAASHHPGVSFSVTEPLGLHDKLIEVILERASEQRSD